MLLDYGYRSKCCYAPLRMGSKKLRKGGKIKVWVCTACGTTDVGIVPKEDRARETTQKFAPKDPRFDDD